jgi:hypothetical protein
MRSFHVQAHEVVSTLETGAKRLPAQQDKELLFVRHRYDVTRGVRLKTVELVVEEKPGCPMFLFQDSDMVPVEVRFEETELREKLHRIRARWDSHQKLWLVPYRLVRGTELEARIPEEFINWNRKL